MALPELAENYQIDHTLDTQGLNCPVPVMMLHNAVRKMKAGEILEVIATDPSTQMDIPKFSSFLGHKLLKHREFDSKFLYHLKKGGGAILPVPGSN
ncbi:MULTISPECIES: sulfurtransferase TusA [unclassified Endozoicomonas]|uniref:sulfurtransferase TusA n=1 Tax=unclassified Endozoicomonas TaxID=2644528 RepID=UPI003BB5883D